MSAGLSVASIESIDASFDVPHVGERPLRVLSFSSLFPNDRHRLHGLFVRQRVRALARRCDVRVVAPVPVAPWSALLPQRYRQQFERVSRVENQDGLTVAHPRFLTIPKFFKTTDGAMMAAWCAAAVRGLRREFPFDVIDAHWAYPDGFAAAALARWCGVPLVLTVRGDDINIFGAERGRGRMIRMAIESASLVIALSDDLKDAVERLVPNGPPTVVVPNGVDPEIFRRVDRSEARQRLQIGDQERLIVSVGRLHTSKGFPVLVEAFGRLKDQIPNLRVAIIGSPDPEADASRSIREAASRCGVIDRLILPGPQHPDVLVDWYNAADLFCLPTSREGSANVLYEALACGLPCVTTPVGGNSAAVSGPHLGVLAAAEPEEMAVALEGALTRTWNRALIASIGSSRTWDVVACECRSYLASVVARAAPQLQTS